MYYITDKNGESIQVADLDAAMEQALLFKGYRLEQQAEALQETAEELQAYWEDIYEKLLALQAARI